MRQYLLSGMLACMSLSTFAQHVLTDQSLQKYVTAFNAADEEAVKNYVPNAQSQAWLSQNIPYFDSPDSVLTQLYYYRWWAFRKHLKQTPDGFIFTEFITPVKHAGKHNAISSALGHHVYEGRWLRNPQYIDEYISFWLYVDPRHTVQRFHSFSSWLADAVYQRYLVNRDESFVRKITPALAADYRRWESERQLPNQLFWQHDVKDAMEESISGGRKVKNVRPTINSYMYGNAKALAALGQLLKNDTLRETYLQKALQLKQLTQQTLWNEGDQFFEVKLENGTFANAREAIGFIPWYFNLPDDSPKYAAAWKQLGDTTGFQAPWGLTTAERRHPGFRTHGSGHGCEWDGPLWPFATTQTLKALSHFLTDYQHNKTVSRAQFFDELRRYADSHVMNGKLYLGEYQDEKNGEWLKGDDPRSKFYNHSGFADLIINDLIGLKPRSDDTLEIKPLLEEKRWDWFCLDRVPYHGKTLTILWDKTGKKYGKGKGFRVWADGKEVYHGKQLKAIQTRL
ncbi:glycosyl hydrolase family 65 protein [Siphonobacter sp. BAB-5385]|uniref:MGH1-like glycoside hydrolase domain-containing protein n=1 Tax=Siphonobacter sp. BAB-5385 TaxID=1864822 RepID=UPI0011406DC9|nr:glycosyl hydrolase family 65 protein [Siphonobacter sp. BAB-5385]